MIPGAGGRRGGSPPNDQQIAEAAFVVLPDGDIAPYLRDSFSGRPQHSIRLLIFQNKATNSEGNRSVEKSVKQYSVIKSKSTHPLTIKSKKMHAQITKRILSLGTTSAIWGRVKCSENLTRSVLQTREVQNSFVVFIVHDGNSCELSPSHAQIGSTSCPAPYLSAKPRGALHCDDAAVRYGPRVETDIVKNNLSVVSFPPNPDWRLLLQLAESMRYAMESPQYTIYPSLRGKKILVTGGAEGIGASAVELFAQQGSKVALLDISESSAKALIESIQKKSSQAAQPPWAPAIQLPTFYQCDVTNLDQLKAQAKKILDDFGGTIDVLVNNAAAAGSKSRVPSVGVTPESWDFDVNVNLRHAFFLTQAVVPSMQKQGRGSIINMGSITWRIPSTDTPVYATCKAAILGMTRTHSKEFGEDGIRVNSIMPGSIATERQRKEVLTPEYEAKVLAAQSLKRNLMPEEVGRVILFLASDDSSAVTGSSYIVDGGFVGD
ncbi:hypothetical protein KC333_g6 [Hortaea werneckii]|nr:hypothetical protein KC333_g6 [Hortaea werneckii]